MSSQKSGPSGSRPVPESEHKKAGSKTPASRERTQIPEDHLLRRTVVTTGFPRSGLVQSLQCVAEENVLRISGDRLGGNFVRSHNTFSQAGYSFARKANSESSALKRRRPFPSGGLSVPSAFSFIARSASMYLCVVSMLS